MNIDSLVTTCVAQLEARHEARERALAVSRTLIRLCASTINAAHRTEFAEAARLLGEASVVAANLRRAVVEHADLLASGYTQDALKEYAEAALVYAFLVGNAPPSAGTLNVEPAAFLVGLAEAASELRRAILDRLRRGDIHQGEVFLSIMEEIYGRLMTVDYPDALTGGLRRSTDALRAVLERTRGDVTATICQERLSATIRDFEESLVRRTETPVDTPQA